MQETQGTTVNPILTGLGIDERYARNDTTGRTYYLTDHLGSTHALTDAAGNVVNRYDYDPYGNVQATSSAFTNPYQYTGREQDANGLLYYRARYYNPGMGRFIAEDPIGLAGGLNTYGYVYGDPLSYTDPTGEIAFFGMAFGFGSELAIQLALNGGRMECVDWVDVFLSTAVGAIAPGMFQSAKRLRDLNMIMNKTKSANVSRKAGEEFGDAFLTQAGWQVSKFAGKEIFGAVEDAIKDVADEKEWVHLLYRTHSLRFLLLPDTQDN